MNQNRLNLPITGICSFAKYPICTDWSILNADFAVLGIPYDLGVGYLPGARFGPRRIRESSAQYGRGERGFYDPERETVYLAHPCKIVDCGDIDIETGNLEKCMENMEESVRYLLQRKTIPVMMGGDHSVTTPIGKALNIFPKVDIIQLDAHLDWTNNVGSQLYSNGSPMRRLSEMNHIDKMTQIGLRGLGSSKVEDFEDAKRYGSQLISAKLARELGVKKVLDKIPESNCCYVTIDIDALDISIATGVGSPMPGGLDYTFVTDLLEGIAKKCNVIGFDLVEVAPQYDPSNATCRIASLIMLSFMGFIYNENISKKQKTTR